MQLLQSDWLIRMLQKSSQSPQVRMLNLFSILNDWLDAPQINVEVGADIAERKLQNYLALEAAKAGAQMPEVLADQLYFMAVAATQEKLQNQNVKSFAHAKDAAQAMIMAQTEKTFHLSKKIAYATAASVCTLLLAGSLYFMNATNQNTAATYAQNAQLSIVPVVRKPVIRSALMTASPTKTAALFARIEQMRKGECQLLEAIQLPDAYKAIYFENIVQGQISSNVDDQRIVNELLSKVRCNYTPMLMANSKG